MKIQSILYVNTYIHIYKFVCKCFARTIDKRFSVLFPYKLPLPPPRPLHVLFVDPLVHIKSAAEETECKRRQQQRTSPLSVGAQLKRTTSLDTAAIITATTTTIWKKIKIMQQLVNSI